jgi:hypothetical protein
LTRRYIPVNLTSQLDLYLQELTKTLYRLKETGEILFASDTKLAIDITSDKRVAFEQDEMNAVKRFDKPGDYSDRNFQARQKSVGLSCLTFFAV